MNKYSIRPHADFSVDLDEGVTLEMVWIPGGVFKMGEAGYKWEEPVHEVQLDGFWMGKYPVTQAQHERRFRPDPDDDDDDSRYHFKGADLPADSADRYFSSEYCDYIAEMTGQSFNLPTEAEWEYACRGGTETRYFFGDDPKHLDEFAWHRENSGGKTHPVGLKKPNPFGLYDIYGNVWEWCRDTYNDNFYKRSPRENPVCVKPEFDRKVLRGGSWCSLPHACRSGFRYTNGGRMNSTGLRVVAHDEKYTRTAY